MPPIATFHSVAGFYWLRALKDDKRLIFKAASEAQKAAEWLMKGQQVEDEERAAA